MSGAEIRRLSVDRRGLVPNVFLGIGSGALLALADALIHPLIVLPLFVAALTDDLAVVGLIPAIAAGVWWLGRLPAVVLVRPRRQALPWATGALLVRIAAVALLAYVVFGADRFGDAQLVRSFFICYVVYHLSGGFAAGPLTEALARSVAVDQRARVFRQRVIWGAALGIVAGFVVARLLGTDGPTFPRGHALLFLTAAVCLAAATFLMASVREPTRFGFAPRPPAVVTLRALPRPFGDPNFRRFIGFRALLALVAATDPFFVVYAQRELAVPGAAFGFFLVAFLAARFGFGVVWGPLVARHGEKVLLQSAALLRLLAPLVALILPYLVESQAYRDRVDDPTVAATLFGLVFVALGAALGAQARANFDYLGQIAPDGFRPAYANAANMVLALLAAAPIAGGLIATRYDLERAFLVAALAGLAAVFASGALTNTQARTRPVASAWRLRRTSRA